MGRHLACGADHLGRTGRWCWGSSDPGGELLPAQSLGGREDYLARIRWVKGEKATRASVILQKRVGGKVSADLNEILVVVPSKWRFISKVETLRDETPPEKICELGSKLALLGELGL